MEESDEERGKHMSGNLRNEFEKKREWKLKMVTFLWKEKEYADALLEHLDLRYNWAFISTNELDGNVEAADLILTEEGWFDEIKDKEELWRKTVFLLEHQPHEDPLTREEFPYLVWKYDGFSRIRTRIAQAMEAICGKDETVNEELPPVYILGAWDRREDDECWEMANQIADDIKQNILYMNLEKFSGNQMKKALELSYTLEDILYYALDRLELDHTDPSDTVRSVLDVADGVCSLPDFDGFNPLLRLKEEEWKRLIPTLCKASEAAAVFLWTGREELEHCSYFSGHVAQCIYLKPGELPEGERIRWERMKGWLEREGTSMLRAEVHMADSWAEVYKMMKEEKNDLA